MGFPTIVTISDFEANVRLNTYRAMAALGAVILPLWGWLQYASGTDVNEPLAIRVVLACFCAVFLVASLFSPSFVQRIRPMAIALYSAITCFAGYLAVQNNFSMITAMGMLLVFVVVAAILDRRLELIVYTLGHLLFASLAPQLAVAPEVTPWLYLLSTLTVIVFSVAVHVGRLRSEHHRRTAEEALQLVLANLESEVAARTEDLQVTNAELELSRTRYRLATGAARVGVWDLNIRTMELYVDPIFKEILGYQDTPDEHIPLKMLRLVLPDADRRVVMKAARTNMGRRSRSLSVEHRARCRNGQLVWLFTRGAAICDERGRPERLLGTGTDITEFKTTELALQENEAKFRSLSEAAFEGLLVLDGTRVRNANEKFCEMFGWGSGEVVGRDISEFVAADDVDRLRDCLRLMTCGVMEFEALHRAGDSFPVEINASRFSQQGADCRVAAFRDLTERRRLERTRELLGVLEKEKAIRDLRSRFVAMASHEFRTPLATIRSTADLLVQYPDRIDPEKSTDYLNSILSEVEHMTDLLDDILIFGQADAGKFEFRPEPLDVGALCAELVEKFERTPGNRDRFDCSFDSGGRPLLDEKMVRLIVSNLISNALKYSPSDCSIEIRAQSNRAGTAIEVADRGIGIAEEDRALLFAPFHRGANVGGRSGTGLGLAITKMAVEMHGGTIELGPREQGGTRIRVHLPQVPGEVGAAVGASVR